MQKDLFITASSSVDSSSVDICDFLDGIELSDEKENEVLLEAFAEMGISFIPLIGRVFEFAGSVKSKLDEARQQILLSKLRSKCQNSEEFNLRMSKLISSPYGLSILHKISRILNADVFNPEYFDILASVLKNVSDTNIKDLFDEHNYALSQIEQLSPQALILLKDYLVWPTIEFAQTTTSGVTSGDGWDLDFVRKYLKCKNMVDGAISTRIKHAINDLRNRNLVTLRPSQLVLTDIGDQILKSISKPL